MKRDDLDILITETLADLEKDIVEDMPDIEQQWADFEKKVSKPKKLISRKIYKFSLVASVLILVLFQFQDVIAFKPENYRWFSKDKNDTTVITQEENKNIKPGTYSNLTLEEAQALTIFPIAYPKNLPAEIDTDPNIEVKVIEYPYVDITMHFKGKNSSLIFVQENTANESSNTFVPSNVEVKEIMINKHKVIFIGNENNISANWANGNIKYTLISSNLDQKTIENLIKNIS